MTETARPSIFEVFAQAKAQVAPVGKDSRNQQQNFNFRGIDAVVNAVAPALDKLGVITCPVLGKVEYTTVEVGQKRTPMAHVRVEVTYRFYGPAGDHFDAVVPGEAMDSGDKGTAKAMSVAYRIALIQALNLPTGDPDPDTQTYERSSRESFDDASPAPQRGPRSARNGSGGQAARPPQPQAPAAPGGDIDKDAQELANEAHEARILGDLRTTWTKASGAGKLASTVSDPATGEKVRLIDLIGSRRGPLEDLEAALMEFQEAAEARRMAAQDMEVHVRRTTGVDFETASAAQIRQAVKALEAAA